MPDEVQIDSSGVSRRTLVKGAVWSVPVIAVATSAPLAAASGELALAWGPVQDIVPCQSMTATYVTLTNAGAPVAGSVVQIFLPNGLKWSDTGVPGWRSFVTDAQGRVELGGTTAIVSTGRGGDYVLFARTPGLADVPAALKVEVSTGAIWYSGNATTASQADSAGTVRYPVALAVAGSYVWAKNQAQELYVHAGAVDGPWNKVTIPAVSKVVAVQGNNYGMAIAGGRVYRLQNGDTTALDMGALPSPPQDIAGSGLYAYVLLADGTWWWRWLHIDGDSWKQLVGGPGTYTSIDVNEGGGYGWAIGNDGEVYWVAPGGGTGNNVQPSDPTNVLANAVETAIGSSYAYARTASGAVFAKFAASTTTPWSQMSGLPAGGATHIYTGTGSNWAWALANGTLYYSGNASQFFPADSAGALSAGGPIAEVKVAANWVYVKTSDGRWWAKGGASDGGWRVITGVPNDEVTGLANNWGDWCWAIAPAVQPCL